MPFDDIDIDSFKDGVISENFYNRTIHIFGRRFTLVRHNHSVRDILLPVSKVGGGFMKP
jgi:hypothetical protein